MLRVLVDENFHFSIVRGLIRRQAPIDWQFCRDVLPGENDAAVLDWAAKDDRIVVSHDANTMTRDAYQRVIEGKPMAGLIIVPAQTSVGDAVRDLHLIAEAANASDLRNQILYVPL
jgi:predicted nuclease of predicted toxin-antitoxin system